jgi:hypothetical protein
MNDKNLLESEKAVEFSKKYIKGEEDMAKVTEIIKDCIKGEY